MTILKEYLEAIEYKVSEGSDFGWKCFGENARYLECHGPILNQDYSIHAVFDSVNQFVYAIEAWDYRNDRTYRWIDPAFQKAHRKEAKKHNVDPDETFDGNKYIDLDVPEDIFEKINAMVNNREYDSRIKVPVDFSDEELLQYMKIAHEMDITFNELVERALKEAIDDHKRDPEGFAKRAKDFINEDSTS